MNPTPAESPPAEPVLYQGTLYASTGVLRYSHKDGYGHRLVMEVDPGLADYYRKLVPTWLGKFNRPLYPAHVSVVRKEMPPHLAAWGRHEGEEVEFFYANYVCQGAVYLWLNVFCRRLDEVRLGLGLPVSSPYTRPPEGFRKCYHLTLLNRKEHPHD